MSGSQLKTRVARSLKWNIVDRVSTQALYALTGIVLARQLSTEDFGLIGALLVFQAFASLLVDSGFSYALIQRRSPSRLDYSTVLWFNIAVSVVLYAVLWFALPAIALIFQGDMRLVPLGRALFLSLILNAACIVQANRLVKAMDVRMVAVSNSLGLVIGGIAGITLALTGFGAWAIVWQTIVLAAVKGMVLWTTGRWRPMMSFSFVSLRSYASLGTKMMFTSFLNTLFLNIYSFFIGNRVGLSSLGYYTQGDKWSKMGISSLSQVFTSTFVPALSAVQHQPVRYRAVISKINRLASYLLFPSMLWLTVLAEPVFHALFGTKWDPSVALFRILLLRGIFVVLASLYSNYQLSLGHGGVIVRLEILRDVLAVTALGVTYPYMSVTTEADPVYGLRILLWGQFAATALTWAVSLAATLRITGIGLWRFLRDMAPYAIMALLLMPLMLVIENVFESPWLKIAFAAPAAVAVYLLANYLAGSKIQRDILGYLFRPTSARKQA